MTKTFTDRDDAFGWMLMLNQASRDNSLWVLVDGPVDDEFWVMPIKDAIENEFMYEWSK